MPETLHPHSNEAIMIDETLALRALTPDQAGELFAVTHANSEYLSKWLPWVAQVDSPQESAFFIARADRRRTLGNELGYGIVLDDAIVGHISLMHVLDGREPEIGCWVSEECSGRGVATRAVQALTGFGFQTMGLDKIIIRANPGNIGSNRIAEKLGYRLERKEQNKIEGVLNVWAKYRD